ncbi:probable FAD synthase isoform X2 [Zea mays]|uniref:FAD synthase n=1 Tax=Zea mays TaxID=4577 RepID=A0A804N1P0_MAIZE|nr:probable FAD synthase isoform X2 [Zea mays]|eukprot:XP_020405770.1 probable FAD synthase isoform X2 [Zea mays]
MEIEQAMRGSSDVRLRAKYDAAVYIVRRAYALYPFEELAFSFNGGKDSTVLLHLLRAGYYLHRASSGGDVDDDSTVLQTVKNCPMRTIYFEDPDAFPEIDCFTYETASTYGLPLESIRTGYKSGLEALLKEKPTKAILLGTRNGDPNAVGQQEFSPSSPDWPPFMRVNPILDWSYSDVWSFLLTCKVQYCSLYDQGVHNTVPNQLLRDGPGGSYRPAYTLSDGSLERAGRAKKTGKRDGSANGTKNNGNETKQ